MAEATKPNITIEYCVPCGYAPRATWMAQELLTPFSETISGLTLTPGDHGVFDVFVDGKRIYSAKENNWAFPEVLQLVEAISEITGPVEYKH